MGVPKCLIEIGGVSILRRQLSAFRAAGVTRFCIVVGYEERAIRDHLLSEADAVTYLVNPRFAETNTLYSLHLTCAHFGEGFFYANGDVLFDRRLPELLLPADGSTRMAVKPGHFGQEEVKVMVEAGRITRIGKALDPARSYGEFIGVARFGGDLVGPFAKMLARGVEVDGIVGEHFESSLDRLCTAGHVLEAADVGDVPCCEIDFPEDLRHAREDVAPKLI